MKFSLKKNIHINISNKIYKYKIILNSKENSVTMTTSVGIPEAAKNQLF